VTAGQAHIVRVLAVRDTRDFVEQGDRWVAVPGSGQARPCDRCGRDHEIHVDVELSDGRMAMIGQGCARGSLMEAAIRATVSAETTRARLVREHARAVASLAASQAAWSEVQALSLPEPRLVEERTGRQGVTQVWQLGDDATVWTLPGRPFDAERRASLAMIWRIRSYVERGSRLLPGEHRARVADLEKRLRRAEGKLADVLATADVR
jgi:hypothetical protein